MAEVKSVTDGEDISKAVWHYVGVGVLWISLILTGLAFERLGLTSNYLTGVFPGEIGSLRTKTVEQEANLRKVMDENQRLSGLIGRERQTAEALDICQTEKKKLEDQLKPAKVGGQ
jgi:hypothetical protein